MGKKRKWKRNPNTDDVSLTIRHLRTLKKYLALHFRINALDEMDMMLFVKSFSESGYDPQIMNREFCINDFKRSDELFEKLYGLQLIDRHPKFRKYYVSSEFDKMYKRLLKWILNENNPDGSPTKVRLHTEEMVGYFKDMTIIRNNYKRVFKYINARNESEEYD